MKKLFALLFLLSQLAAQSQNVGIGTTSPGSTLTINATDPVIGIMNNGMAHSFLQASGGNMRINTSTDNPVGKLLLGTKDYDHMAIDHFGRVSIGTLSDFDALLKINANGFPPRIAIMQSDVPKGLLSLAGENFKIGTYPGANRGIVFSPKNIDKVWITENGLVGIGTSNPVSDLTINGDNPYIELQNNGVNKGFFQNVGNDIRIGTNSNNTTGNLSFQTQLTTRMTIDENGLVGIGTTNPTQALTVNGTDPLLQMRNDNIDKGFLQLLGSDMKVGTNSTNEYGRLIFRTSGHDRMVVNYDGRVGLGTLFPYQSLSINATNPTLGLNIGETLYGSVSIDNATKNLVIEKASNGNGKLVINANGGIGYSIHMTDNGYFHYGGGLTPNGYIFSVQSRVLATDFVSLAVNNWPDYVFGDDYKLRSLAEVREFIEKNKHLPNIPPAAEIEKNGVQLGEMSKKLIEKVEELTLYVLQLQDQVDELKKQVRSPKN